MTKPHRVVPTLTEVLDESLLGPASAKSSDVFLDLNLEDLGGEGRSELGRESSAVLSAFESAGSPSFGHVIKSELSEGYTIDLASEDLRTNLSADRSTDLAERLSQDLLGDLGDDAALGSTSIANAPLSPNLSPALKALIADAVDSALADLRESLLMRVEAAVKQGLAEQRVLDSHPTRLDEPLR